MREDEPEAIVILAGDHIYKMDYRLLVNYHVEKGADATVAAVEVTRKEAAGQFGVLQVDPQNRIIGFEEKPADPKPLPSNPDLCLGSMGIYVFTPSVLYKLLEDDARDPKSAHDLGKNIIPKMVGVHPIFAFSFVDANKKEAKYWRDVGTLDAYYEASMDLVQIDPVFNLYDPEWPLRTYQPQLPPAKFVFSFDGRTGKATDSIVSTGCIVSGGEIRRSILAPNVRVHSYCDVQDSIVMPNAVIHRHSPRVGGQILQTNAYSGDTLRSTAWR